MSIKKEKLLVIKTFKRIKKYQEPMFLGQVRATNTGELVIII